MINEQRVRVVQRAFESLGEEDSFTVNQLYDHFSRVLAKSEANPGDPLIAEVCTITHKDVIQRFVRYLQSIQQQVPSQSSSPITWEQFIGFYVQLAAEIIDKVKSECDLNGLFEIIVERMWHLPCDRRAILLDDMQQSPLNDSSSQASSTNTNTNNDSRSSSCTSTILRNRRSDEEESAERNLVQSTERLDLMWIDPTSTNSDSASSSFSLIGFRAVVQPSLNRDALPDYLRPHIFTAQETKRYPHKYLNAQTALLKPFDLVWWGSNSEDSSSGLVSVLYGMKGVITSSIELWRVPIKLRQHILSSHKTDKIPSGKDSFGAIYVPTHTVISNPIYTKSSTAYGSGYTTNGGPTKNIPRTMLHDTWAGRQGSFTKQFASGPYKYTGLNIH